MRKGRGGAWMRRGAVALAALLAGCGTGDGEVGAVGLMGADRPLAWTVDTAWSAGGVEAPDWAAFGEITGVAFDGSGNLYVLDGRRGRVTVLDRGGGFLRTVGTRGEGPGELRFPVALGVHPGGAVTVYDPGQGGFVVYGADGAYLRNVPVDTDVVPAPEGPLLVIADGGIVSPSRTPADVAVRVVARYDDGPPGAHRVLFQGWSPPLPETTEPGPEATGGLRIRLPPVVAFHPALLVAPLPDGGVAVVDSTTWRITLRGPDGAAQSHLERPITPIPVTGEIREAERSRWLTRAEADLPRLTVNRSGGGSAAVSPEMVRRLEEARVAGMGFHPVVPVVEDLVADPRGRLWVRRSGARPGEPGPVDVVEPGGAYLGTLAPGVLPPAAVPGPGDRFAVPGVDGMGAPIVRVLRLETGDSPPPDP